MHLLLLASCAGHDAAIEPDWTRDITTTDLAFDLATSTGVAHISLAPSTSASASFEIGDLTVSDVRIDGVTTPWRARNGALDVAVPANSPGPVSVTYAFHPHYDFDGWDPTTGVSFLWPRFCGNLFPCRSDPADGSTFTLAVTGVAAGRTAVYPASIAISPSYVPAIAVAEYTAVELGTTASGTRLTAWHLPGQAADTARGTTHLVDVFAFYEAAYGPYAFGDHAGSVSADWGGGDYGGMEHHPYWHVSSGSMYDEEVHAHEAAHGWFGDGVRIACWEDFVLSEGTATYLARRGLAAAGVDLGPTYACDLADACAESVVALPGTCGAIDLITDPLWSLTPYMKGDAFYVAVADVIGVAELDAALAAFYRDHVGQAARMDDMIAHLEASAPDHAPEIGVLADAWLRQRACPIDTSTLCP